MPTPAELPDGFGTTFTGELFFGFDLVAEGFGVAFGVAFGVGEALPSTTVTLIFCPGDKLSIFTPSFDLSVPVFGGLIVRGFLVEFGVGDAEDFGFGLEGEDGFGFGVSFGVGFGFGFGFGFGVGFGGGFGVASGFVADVGVGFAVGSSVGVGFGGGFGGDGFRRRL